MSNYIEKGIYVPNMILQEQMMEKLVEALPTLRMRLNLTQEELATTLGVARQTILKIENKKTKITKVMFIAIYFIFLSNPKTKPLMAALGIKI